MPLTAYGAQNGSPHQEQLAQPCNENSAKQGSKGAEQWNSVTDSAIQPVTSITPLAKWRMHSPSSTTGMNLSPASALRKALSVQCLPQIKGNCVYKFLRAPGFLQTQMHDKRLTPSHTSATPAALANLSPWLAG